MRDLNVAKGASPHCWRTTFSTWANENGHAPDAIERQLAHVESNRVRATYNKAMMLEERRQIMQVWVGPAEAESEPHRLCRSTLLELPNIQPACMPRQALLD